MQSEDYEIKETLTKVSQDDFGNSVIENTQEVYNFDKIAEQVARRYRASKPARSCDALYIKDADNIFLMEFKNTRSSRVPKNHLKQKAYDSVMTLLCAVDPALSLEEVRKKVTFVVIYNNAETNAEHIAESKAIDQMKEKMYELSNRKRVILFGLEIYKDVFYKDVYTLDKTEFETDMWKRIFGG